MTTARETELSETFVTLADTLVNHFDLTDLLHTLASSCVDLLDADAAGILLAGAGGTLRVMGSSEERMRLLELFEVQNEQGPCMDCYNSGQPVSEPDLSDTDRWPHFTPQALEAGYVSVDALPLRLRDDVIGALNLFRTDPGGVPDSELRIARALADVAAIGLIQERAVRESQVVAEQLQHALDSRVVIEQAKGVLAAQGSVTVDRAFEVMRTYARAHAVSMTTLAHEVIAGEHSIDSLR